MIEAEVIDANRVDGEVLSSDSVGEKVQPMPLVSLNSASQARPPSPSINRGRIPLEVILDVPVTIVFEVGRTNITIKQLMELCEGAFVELRHVSVDSIDVWINDKIIAQGEAIALQQRYGVRIGEVDMIPIAETNNASR